MKAEKIIALLNEIEKKFEVENWIVDDIHIWPLIRLDLMMNLHFNESQNLQTKINLLFKIRQVFGMMRGYVKYLFKLLLDYKKNARLQQADAVLLGDGISRVLLNGKWYDRFCDPLRYTLEKEGKKSLMIEPLHNYLIPRYSPSLFIQPSLDFSLLKNVLFFHKNFKNIQLNGFSEFVEFIKARKLNIPIPDESRLKTIVLAIKSYSEYYTKILKTINPTQGFVVSYYGPKGLAFNLACYRLKIPSVDVQHGVAGEFNPAYGRWSKVPQNGYETLPSLFYCWTKEDAQAIERWNTKVQKWHKPILKGNMLVDFWKNNAVNDKSAASDLEDKKGTANILLTLSSVEDHNVVLLSKIMKVIKQSDKDLQWWIRLHPCLADRKNEIEKIFHKEDIRNIEIDQATDLPLYALLGHMNLHVTYVSATVTEARMFGLHSIVTGEDALQYFADEIKTGWAIYATTTDEIEKAINKFLKLRYHSSPTSN
ncbi:glycosyltransferase [Candidatus Peregrinibacteria bacterium]|nr:glycosyltransferase [Candidatus Peregrinibacteria bacterium]